METKWLRVWIFTIVVAMALHMVHIAEGAEETRWIGAIGDWFDPSNWEYILPTSADGARIDNGGTAQISGGSAAALWLALGHNIPETSGNISHTAGTLEVGDIWVGDIGSGTYDLSGTARLSTGSICIGYSAGNLGVGILNQTGGSVSVANIVTVAYHDGTGTYNLSTGDLRVTGDLLCGVSTAPGIFNQTGGSVDTKTLFLGVRSWSVGTYNLSGAAQLSSLLDQTIGEYGTGTFNQTGGTNTAGGNITLGLEDGSQGTYKISGGTLTAKQIRIGHWGTGRFDIEDSAASITVSEKLFFGDESTFTAVADSAIHMKGAWLDITSKNPTELSGLNNLSLIFEGGANVGFDTLEVAGQDIGAQMSGFDKNFALDVLILGGVDIGQVKLIDSRDNMSGTEALYVKDLVLGNGSRLDLNGLNLYCLNFTGYGGTVELSGGQMILVPEPSTLLLLGVAGLLAAKRRR